MKFWGRFLNYETAVTVSQIKMQILGASRNFRAGYNTTAIDCINTAFMLYITPNKCTYLLKPLMH